MNKRVRIIDKMHSILGKLDLGAMEPVRWRFDPRTLMELHIERGFWSVADYRLRGERKILSLPFSVDYADRPEDLCIAEVPNFNEVTRDPFQLTLECTLRKNGRTVYVDHKDNEEPWK